MNGGVGMKCEVVGMGLIGIMFQVEGTSSTTCVERYNRFFLINVVRTEAPGVVLLGEHSADYPSIFLLIVKNKSKLIDLIKIIISY